MSPAMPPRSMCAGLAGSRQRAQAYVVHSDLDLFSNSTYFLEDDAAGNQIRQRDRGRWMAGADLTHVQPLSAAHRLTFGLQTRYDIADVALFRSRARRTIATVRADDVREWGTGLYVQAESRWTPILRTVFGLRGDACTFAVDAQHPANSGSARDAIVSPKASVILQPSDRLELYASAGLGLHSNDARGTTQTLDPVSA
jgi:outer membrane receptor protein involved in Fe transport